MPDIEFHMIGAAPAPVAPYSHATETDGWVFVTGQLPIEPGNETAPLPVGIEAQTEKTMENLKSVLRYLGLGFEDVVMARVFLNRFKEDYEAMNRVYAGYFSNDRKPARTCIGVTGLARDALVEIDLIARRS